MAAPMRLFRFCLSGVNSRFVPISRLCSTSNNGSNSKTTIENPNDQLDKTNSSDSTSTEAQNPIDPTAVGDNTDDSLSKGGLDKAFAMFDRVDIANEPKPASIKPDADYPDTTESFASLFRKSSVTELGDPDGRIVLGEVFEVVDNDLYIDFGGKFHCVCNRPEVKSEDYKRGAKVRLRLRDLELSSHFMGATRDITLLEADASLLGIARK